MAQIYLKYLPQHLEKKVREKKTQEKKTASLPVNQVAPKVSRVSTSQPPLARSAK